MSTAMRRRGADVGSGFQEAVNRTNEIYERLGIACVTRKAIPGKYIVSRESKRRGLNLPTAGLEHLQTGGRVNSADLRAVLKGNSTNPRSFIPESRAEPDYGGCLAPQGRAIFYDAKSTSREQLDFDNLHPHQLSFLERTARMGAVAGFLVEFAAHREIYFLPIQVVVGFRAAFPQRKSVPYRFFAANLIPVKPGRGLLMHDYLSAIREQEERHGADFGKLDYGGKSVMSDR